MLYRLYSINYKSTNYGRVLEYILIIIKMEDVNKTKQQNQIYATDAT